MFVGNSLDKWSIGKASHCGWCHLGNMILCCIKKANGESHGDEASEPCSFRFLT